MSAERGQREPLQGQRRLEAIGDGGGTAFSSMVSSVVASRDAAGIRRLLELVIANLSEAMVVADAQGNLILQNPASLALHGYDNPAASLGEMEQVAAVWEVSDLAGRPLPPEEWPLARALRGERFAGYEVRVRRSDTGKSFVGAYSGVPILDESGTLQYAMITIRDVTQQKAAEEAGRQRDTRLRLALEAANLGVWIHDLESEESSWDGRAREIFGFSPGQPAPVSLEERLEWIHPDDRDRVRAALSQAMAPGSNGAYAIEKRIVRPDGSLRWVVTRGRVQFEGEKATQLTGIVSDVTAQKEAQAQLRELNDTLEERIAERTRALNERTQALAQSSQALREAHNRFFTLFHASPIPTHLVALEDGAVLDANQAYLDLFHLRREAVVGRRASELALQMNAPQEERTQIRAFLQGQGAASGVEMHLADSQGELHTVLLSAEVVSLDGRQVVISTLLDISERKRAEEKVRELAMELSLAQERERARIAQILHDDVQQMLVALQMHAELGLHGGEEEMRAALGEVRDYAQEILTMTRDLSVELSAPPLSRDGLAAGLSWVQAYMGERYGFTVEADVPEEVTLSDRDLMGVVVRLVRELLFNTLKHAGVERARLRARREGERVVIEVADEGAGFDPRSLKLRPGGTGYGLLSMAERVRLFGGDFQLHSAPGKGTRATIVLPTNGRRPRQQPSPPQ